MPDFLLIENCSPTLAGLKTGSLFSCRFSDANELNYYLTKWNFQLNPKGVFAVLFRHSGKRAFIYVYRPKNLTDCLNSPTVIELLSSMGYKIYSINYCLDRLSNRIACGDNFPHEIGVFLGYPVEDVIAFIKNQGQNSKYTGYWKAYSNVNEAKAVFHKWSICKDVYIRMFFAGNSVAQLTKVVL